MTVHSYLRQSEKKKKKNLEKGGWGVNDGVERGRKRPLSRTAPHGYSLLVPSSHGASSHVYTLRVGMDYTEAISVSNEAARRIRQVSLNYDTSFTSPYSSEAFGFP